MQFQFFSNKYITSAIIAIVAFASLITIYDTAVYYISGGDEELINEIVEGISDSVVSELSYELGDDEYSYIFNDCYDIWGNVAKVKIVGDITSEGYSLVENGEPVYVEVLPEEIIYYLNEIDNDNTFSAIILSIDSLGGYAVPSEQIAKAIKRIEKPVVAVVESSADSGGYIIASSADYIFASKLSEVGAIGVTMSYLDYSTQNLHEGVKYNSLSSGKFKDMGDPDKTLTYEERNLLMRDVQKAHDIVVEMIAENRNLTVEEIQKLADGSTMLGEDALANKLIDEIGGEYQAMQWLAAELNQEVSVCNYN